MIDNIQPINEAIKNSFSHSEAKTEVRGTAQKFAALFVQKMLENNGVDKTNNGHMKKYTNNLGDQLFAEKITKSPSNALVQSIERELIKRYE